MFKLIAIIIGVLFTPILNKQETVHIQQPKNLVTQIANSGYETLYPKATFGGTSTTFSNLSNNILITFNDGTVLLINTNNGYVELNLKDTSNNVTNLATYQYNTNYTYTLTTTELRGILFEDNINTNNININGSNYNYTYFMESTPNSSISNFQTLYLITANTQFDNTSYWNGYNIGYEQGYDIGVNDGENDVLTSPSNYNVYTYEQWLQAYYQGIEDATTNDFSLYGLVSAILTAPALFVKEAFNFEFFGVNISNLIMFFITLSIVIWIIGFFRKK